jgi:predicted RNA methylase
MSRPLTSAVVHEFSSAFRHNGHGVQKAGDAWSLAFGFYKVDAAVRREVARVVRTLGGVWKSGAAWFDFNPREILFDLISSGCVPDQAAHQFYPTPKSLAQRMVLKANVRAGERVLEPSAGTGSLAAEVLRACPEAELTCVEVSPFFAKACRAKLATVQGASTWSVDVGDFLAQPIDTYDVVIMNPPFADGRWEAHLARAWEHVSGNAGARLVAMLPASAKRVVEDARADGGLFAGMKVSWSEVFEGEFVGTSVSTIILRVEVVGQ